MTADERPPAELLIQALETLPPEDRKRVTHWVLSRLSGNPYPNWGHRFEREEILREPRAGGGGLREDLHALSFQPFPWGGGGQQVMPVRLPADLHARLRTWSTDHGFSMATVVRGLVARFLDSQGAAPAADSAPAEGSAAAE